MSLKGKTETFYRNLTNPIVVKVCWIGAITIWIGGIIIALLIAQLDPKGPSYDPAGFNPLINFISDLGNQDLTPMPIILNWTMMNTAILLIPPALYMKEILIEGTSKIRKIIANITVLSMLIGILGLFLTGVISEDVSVVWDKLFPLEDNYPWHDITADFAFTLLMLAGILVASQFIIYPDILDNKIDVKYAVQIRILYIINSWVITPVCFYFFYTVPYLWYTDNFWSYLPMWKWAPIWEWLLMISLTVWLLSACILVVKQINKDNR